MADGIHAWSSICPNWALYTASRTRGIYGDLVTIINDANKVQQLQKGHGEWIEIMRHALGKICKVVKVYSDGDLRIQQLDDGFEWTLNPKCVKLERSPLATAAERSNSMMDLSHRRADHVMTPLSGLSGSSVADKLVREAAQGHLDFVRQYLDVNPSQVDVMSGGKACIQVASHQGYVDLVSYLISKGANVNAVDKEGDSALHYAAFGNQPATMRVLLQHGAEVNFLNSSHCSALHICAHKKTPHCVRELLQHNANVNIQDSYGDTALHDAIGKENTEVVELLCNAPNLDFTVKNNRGFNVLHHAALKGNVVAARRILLLSRQLVNVRKDDGFAALHLAALNGHAQVVETLVTEGQAELDIRNNRQQTPFLLAVSQGHAGVIERLVRLSCDVNAKDEDGDNAMHLCVIKKSNLQSAAEPQPEEAPEIHKFYLSLVHSSIRPEDRLMYSILIYLSRAGCRVELNNANASIFEWITDRHIRQLIFGQQGEAESLPRNLQALEVSAVSADGEESAASAGAESNGAGPGSVAAPPPPQRQTFELMPKPNDIPAIGVGASPSTPSASPGVKKLNSDATQQNVSPQVAPRKKAPKPPVTTSSTSTALEDGAAGPSTSPVIVPGPQECIVCNEILPMVRFEPCQHQIACEECGIRMKKCLRCAVAIERRLTVSGRVVALPTSTSPSDPTRLPSGDLLRYLENKVLEFEESHFCGICMERKRDVAFLCGHGACSHCAETLRTCHMCRKTILKKINLY
ncbi:E3 ubiquitin-protein ligase MIB2 isoform X2 [Drosophila sechellia]|uniref:E3 ubiquitin-protein ligase MIB2 isoform X2 n=1 Tax=Drosophila sechellia TaxID=7238 RepID=UPI0013DE68B5|nr:E3 ubiquitin-protein ligase MIB2 isoform X2 [Drosophila sechellia]